MLGSQGGLYVGGVPSGLDVSNVAASLYSLKGCLSDLIVNSKLQGLDTPVAYKTADIGRCVEDYYSSGKSEEITTTTRVPSFTITVTRPESSSDGMTEEPEFTTVPGPTELPTSCAVEGAFGYISDAVAFGDVISSHAEIIVKKGEVNRDFNISVELRTLYRKGLIFYVTNELQTEYVAVQLDEGRMVIAYDDRGVTRQITSQGDLDDGLWHKVAVKKDRKSITLQVDDLPATVGRITRKVDVIAPLYVGGLPAVYSIREGVIPESFKGCMRQFELNNKSVDLANSKAIMGVRQCFSDFEPGVHFDGYGYAIYDYSYQISTDFKVSMEFRTVKRDGVLLSLSDIYEYPALTLEIYDGQLMFSVRNQDGLFSARTEVCPHCLCDNKWHTVTAELIKNVATVRVDGRKLRVGVSKGYEQSLNTDHELYIGGFPVFALPQGAAHTNEFFRGCIKNLRINGTLVDWHSVAKLVDVHVSVCPLSVT